MMSTSFEKAQDLQKHNKIYAAEWENLVITF